MKTTHRLTVCLLLLAVSNLSAATRYVWQASPSPGPPYSDLTSAAHVIQEAVDAALAGDTVLSPAAEHNRRARMHITSSEITSESQQHLIEGHVYGFYA